MSGQQQRHQFIAQFLMAHRLPASSRRQQRGGYQFGWGLDVLSRLNFGVEQIVNLLPETIKATARTQEPKSIWSIGNSARVNPKRVAVKSRICRLTVWSLRCPRSKTRLAKSRAANSCMKGRTAND